MKRGDAVFISTERDVNVFGTVSKVTDDKIVIRVENGGYELTVHAVKIPRKVVGDYSNVMKWYKENVWEYCE